MGLTGGTAGRCIDLRAESRPMRVYRYKAMQCAARYRMQFRQKTAVAVRTDRPCAKRDRQCGREYPAPRWARWRALWSLRRNGVKAVVMEKAACRRSSAGGLLPVCLGLWRASAVRGAVIRVCHDQTRSTSVHLVAIVRYTSPPNSFMALSMKMGLDSSQLATMAMRPLFSFSCTLLTNESLNLSWE